MRPAAPPTPRASRHAPRTCMASWGRHTTMHIRPAAGTPGSASKRVGHRQGGEAAAGGKASTQHMHSPSLPERLYVLVILLVAGCWALRRCRGRCWCCRRWRRPCRRAKHARAAPCRHRCPAAAAGARPGGGRLGALLKLLRLVLLHVVRPGVLGGRRGGHDTPRLPGGASCASRCCRITDGWYRGGVWALQATGSVSTRNASGTEVSMHSSTAPQPAPATAFPDALCCTAAACWPRPRVARPPRSSCASPARYGAVPGSQQRRPGVPAAAAAVQLAAAANGVGGSARRRPPPGRRLLGGHQVCQVPGPGQRLYSGA